MEYELLFFTSVANEDRVSEIKKEIEEIIGSVGGKISADFTDIGKRKFAHPIKRQTHGFFSFCWFEIEDKNKIPEINRRLGLADKVMRHLIVRADEIGKPISPQPATETREKHEVPKKEVREEKPKEKKAEAGGKVEMESLDEKLSEILDETPT